MVKEGSCWERKLSGYVWRVEKVHERGPFELELQMLETGERIAMSKEYLEQHFRPIEDREGFCEACEGDVTTPHRADCNYATGN